MKTNYGYNVVFNDSECSNNKGFSIPKQNAIDYCLKGIEDLKNGLNIGSYFDSYRGGMVSVICNRTGRYAWDKEIPE